MPNLLKSINFFFVIAAFLAGSAVLPGCGGDDSRESGSTAGTGGTGGVSYAGIGGFSGVGGTSGYGGTSGNGGTGATAAAGGTGGTGEGDSGVSSGSCDPANCPGRNPCCTADDVCGYLNRNGECVARNFRWDGGSPWNRDGGNPWNRDGGSDEDAG